MKHHPSRRGSTASLAVGGALALAICSSALAAAPSGSPASVGGFEGKTISVWFPGADENAISVVNESIVPSFEAATGATVDVTFVPWEDLSAKLNTAFAGGAAPDVFGHGPAAAAGFVDSERIENLDSFFARMDEANRTDISSALPGGQVNGSQYLVPLSMQGMLLAYNAADFTAAGLDPDAPPTTWESIAAAAQTLTQRSGSEITRAGLLVPTNPIGDEQTFLSLLSGSGGSLLTADGSKSAVSSAEGVKALQYMVDLCQGAEPVSNLLGDNYVDRPTNQQPIATGDASMTLLPAEAMAQLTGIGPGEPLRIAPAPMFEGGRPAVFGGAGDGLMMNSDSTEKDLAWQFIDYMVSPAVAAEYTARVGAIPTHQSAIDSEYVKSHPVIQAFLEQEGNFVSNPNIPQWVMIRDILSKHLQEALFGQVSATDALEAAAAETDALLASGG